MSVTQENDGGKPRLQALAEGLLVLRALRDAVKATSEEWERELVAEAQRAGASQVAPTMPDGTKVATVSIVRKADVRQAVQPDRLLEWAQTNAPQLVEWTLPELVVSDDTAAVVEVLANHAPHLLVTVPGKPQLEPGLLADWLLDLTARDDGTLVDVDTGEVVPGVAVKRGTVSPSVRFTKEGKAALADTLQVAMPALHAAYGAPELPEVSDGE